MDFSRRNLFCRLSNISPQEKKEKRLANIKKIGLLENKTISVFDEATEKVAKFLEIPICILGVMINDQFEIKSSVGLSKFGLNNEITKQKKISFEETFATHIIDSQSNLIVENALIDPFFSRISLTQHYGIYAYLGVPLITSEGNCIGVLEVMDLTSRKFSEKECHFVEITARWCLAEYEKNLLLNQVNNNLNLDNENTLTSAQNLDNLAIEERENLSSSITYIKEIVDNLITKLIKNLSNPLTLIIGMSSVLKSELYGKLSEKQAEYIEIIHNSGQDINLLVDKIIDLENFDNQLDLSFTSFDLDLLIRQVIKSLELLIKKQEHTVNLFIENDNHIWKLDKQKLRQTIYYILVTLIEGSSSGGEVQIYVASSENSINFNFWVRHPWLGEGISFENTEIYNKIIQEFNRNKNYHENSHIKKIIKSGDNSLYGLLFSCYLTDLQGGKIDFQGTQESGFRFLLSLPSPRS